MSSLEIITCVSCFAGIGLLLYLMALSVRHERDDWRNIINRTQCPFCGAQQANATLLGEVDRWVCGSYQRHTGACCREDSCIAALVRSEPPDEIVSLEWDEAPRQKLLRDAESD